MTKRTIARLYKDVSVSGQDGGFVARLDGKPIRTPARNTLVLPASALAEAVAAEWREQGDTVDPANMPLTGIAYAAIDLVAAQRGTVIEHTLGFGRSDLLCYRAELPAELVARQAKAWDPHLDWAARRHGVRLRTGAGVSYIEQSADAAVALEGVVTAINDFALAALDKAASAMGSLVLGLALMDGRLASEEAFAAAWVDEDYQAEKWGRDAEAEARRARLLAEVKAAERFMRLSLTPHA
jgi:chaperone required for assembly of F1-ATPase